MIIIITIIILHLAGSPGSCFAYLKDCLEEWSIGVLNLVDGSMVEWSIEFGGCTRVSLQ